MVFLNFISKLQGLVRRTFRQGSAFAVTRRGFKAIPRSFAFISKANRWHRFELLEVFASAPYISAQVKTLGSIFLFCLAASPAFAQKAKVFVLPSKKNPQMTIAQSSVMTKPPVVVSQVEETKASPFSIATTLDYSQRIAKEERGELESDTTVFLAPSYRITDTVSIGGRIILSQANYGPRNTTLTNTTLGLTFLGAKLTETLESFYTLGIVLPTDETIRKDDRFQSAINLGAGLRYVHSYFKLSPRLVLTRNFHEYDRNFEGRANIQYRVGASTDLSIPLTDRLAIESSFAYRTGRTYQNSERYDFDFSASVSYDLTKKFQIYAGTSNSRVAALKSNGVDSNISAFDEKTSVFSGGLTYVY